MEQTYLTAILRNAKRPRRKPVCTPGEGGGGTAKGENNYLAEAPKNPAGARPGNRNAVTHGRYTAERVAIRRQISSLQKRARALIAFVDGKA